MFDLFRYRFTVLLMLTKAIISVKVYAGCDCRHRTAGNNCEMCEPLYNNAEYMKGTVNNASVCQSMYLTMLKCKRYF